MKNFLRKLYIWQNVYLKNNYLFTKKKSFSAFGEDIEIKKHFKINFKGFYVDVGCYHPIKANNTLLVNTLTNPCISSVAPEVCDFKISK